MNQCAVNKILSSIPQNSLVHVVTVKGDKICIKDNNKSTANTISVIAEIDYLQITNIKTVNNQNNTTKIFLDYSNISRIEVCDTTRPND